MDMQTSLGFILSTGQQLSGSMATTARDKQDGPAKSRFPKTSLLDSGLVALMSTSHEYTSPMVELIMWQSNQEVALLMSGRMFVTTWSLQMEPA